MGEVPFSQFDFKKLTADEARARAALESVHGVAMRDGHAALAEALTSNSAFVQFLGSVLSTSPYLAGLAATRAPLLQTLLSQSLDATFKACLSGITTHDDEGSLRTEAALMARLRQAKADGHLLIALADLAGFDNVADTTDRLSQLAQRALQATVDWLLLDAAAKQKIVLADTQMPSQDCGISVLAMGKFGASELNYSSDIDLIMLYEPEAQGLSYAHGQSAAELAPRMARQMIKIMQERTGDGYVFRTDLRLRPDPGATQLAISVGFALGYYESRGQNWERAAMIKARPVAGDIAVGEVFLKELRPFVWRRYLDYAAIADIQSIKRQIHAHRGHGAVAIHGHNVKLGRGGIREIEFFVQTQQLIAGGRDPDLRGLSTVAMLAELAAKGWISQQAADDLTVCYGRLRRVEHAIQMLHDEQTHTLPDDDVGMTDIACLLGYDSCAAFKAQLLADLRCVERYFGALFEKEADLGSGTGNLSFTGDEPDPSTVDVLAQLGFERPRDIWGIIRTWHSGRYRALQWAKARERLTELTPFIVCEFGETGQPDAALVRFDTLLERLPAGMQLFSLLQTNPQLLRLIATILSSAPALADTIVDNPLVFDGMLDPTFFEGAPDREELETRWRAFLGDAEVYEEKLDRLRIFATEQRFLISVRLLSNAISHEQAGHAFSDLADVAVDFALDVVKQNIRAAHGDVAGGQVCIMALGRLGSREMTRSSDLDLIMLYDAPDANAMSDGPRPIAASQYYARMTQRLISALSAPTAHGVLYELDFRLRPSGNKGPLATSLAAFERYQLSEAWTWEHMTLCRARMVAGDPALCQRADEVVQRILDADSDGEETRNAIAEMRLRLDRDKPASSVFDVKRARGGMTDIDFIAQYARLTQLQNLNLKNAAAPDIFKLLDDGFIGANDKKDLIGAYDDYSAIIQMVRLCTDDGFHPDKAPRGMTERLLRHFDLPDLAVLETHLADRQQAVAMIAQRVLGIRRDWHEKEA
ncbi:MAG: bifunctional [glutamine synthetase] adenylyltransferase/[glutamine synthetase]-adenylyl-L-tyrosine phosphorylase [Ahrensia sp.]